MQREHGGLSTALALGNRWKTCCSLQGTLVPRAKLHSICRKTSRQLKAFKKQFKLDATPGQQKTCFSDRNNEMKARRKNGTMHVLMHLIRRAKCNVSDMSHCKKCLGLDWSDLDAIAAAAARTKTLSRSMKQTDQVFRSCRRSARTTSFHVKEDPRSLVVSAGQLLNDRIHAKLENCARVFHCTHCASQIYPFFA